MFILIHIHAGAARNFQRARYGGGPIVDCEQRNGMRAGLGSEPGSASKREVPATSRVRPFVPDRRHSTFKNGKITVETLARQHGFISDFPAGKGLDFIDEFVGHGHASRHCLLSVFLFRLSGQPHWPGRIGRRRRRNDITATGHEPRVTGHGSRVTGHGSRALP